MTTAAEDLTTTLGPVFSGRFHPSVAKAGTSAPYAVWMLVSAVPLSDFEGATDLTNWRFQIDIFGREKLEVDELAEAAKTAMDAATLFKSVCLNQQDIWEDPAQYYRVMLEFSVWR